MKSAVAMRVELLAITNAVMLRAGGASSTPWQKKTNQNVTAYWIVRLRGR
jgi:hypothetical protein